MNPGPARHARCRWLAPLACLLAVLAATPAAAQSGGGTSAAVALSPSAPILTHDENGRVVLRATRVTQAIKIDGRLDEAIYGTVSPITEFIQQEPAEGAPVTEKTEAWVLFDDKNFYIVCRCWDEHPERIVANDMRRDGNSQPQHDHFAVELDTFHDQRNGFMFYVTAAGGMRDGVTTDEKMDVNWNGIWEGKQTRFAGGWISEMAIPFASLRYKAGREQTWGIQLRRFIASKNERVHITRLSPVGGPTAIHRMGEAATLVGLETPRPARNLEIKPYAASSVTTDRVSVPTVQNKVNPDAGLDVKYGVTKSLTADFTYNTDFAQVEADQAQINLTRFSLSFPEKRDFFLEGAGMFAFGTPAGSAPSGDAPAIFYSRRIGLSASGSRAVPVIAGGRLSGRTGPWGVGAFSMETDDDAAAGAVRTNFTALRLRRDVLRRSAVGGVLTHRSVSTSAPGANDVWGVDGNFAFHKNVYFAGYLAQSRTVGLDGDDMSYRTQFNYNHDRYGFNAERLVVGRNFNPEVGFLRREDFRRNFVQGRFSPRTTRNRLVRRWTYEGNFEYTTDNDNHLESRELSATFDVEFHSSDSVTIRHYRLFEYLPAPFEISRGVRIPVGGYPYQNTTFTYSAGQQHRVSGNGSLQVGTFYSGNKKTASFNGRVEISPQFGVEPIVSLNWIDLPQGRFTSTVVGARTTFTMSPQMFVAALVQYSSSNTTLVSNVRFRWEYQPGSELFVVYTEGRSPLPTRGSELQSRGLVVKVNRLFRF